MGPLPPPAAGPLYQFNSVLGNTLSTIHSCIVVWVLFCVFTVFGITVEPPLTATSLQSIHSLLFQPLYMATFFCPRGGHCRVRFNCISNYWWLQMSTTPKNYHSVFKWTLMGYLSVWLLCKCSFGSSQNRMSVWTFIQYNATQDVSTYQWWWVVSTVVSLTPSFLTAAMTYKKLCVRINNPLFF